MQPFTLENSFALPLISGQVPDPHGPIFTTCAAKGERKYVQAVKDTFHINYERSH